MRNFTIWLLLLASASPLRAQAIVFENLDELDQRVASSLISSSSAFVSVPIDRRIRLARCPEPAEIAPPVLGAVAVRCPSLGWTVRVRLEHASGAAEEAVVRRGDDILIAVKGAGFEIRTHARALDDGAVGELIHVKSLTSDAKLMVRIDGAGRAITED